MKDKKRNKKQPKTDNPNSEISEHLFPIFRTDIDNAIRVLKNKGTKVEKIEYLKAKIEFSGIEKGLKYYADQDHCAERRPTPIWSGILYTRLGYDLEMYTGKNETEMESFKLGKETWEEYCELKQLLNDVETDQFDKKYGKPQKSDTNANNLEAPVKGVFCYLINKLGIDAREEAESINVYCKRICNKFKLPYTDRVRQNFNAKVTGKLKKQLIEGLLPLIDPETQSLINKHLDSELPPKRNLYA